MAEKSFSRHELYVLRNHIGIDRLIREVLHVPCEGRQGGLSFLCPLCKGYNTGVHYKTNLARCFDCKKNLNTIDLVMIVRQCGFVDSVRFLKKLHDSSDCRDGSGENASWQGAHHIGPILDGLVKPPDALEKDSIHSPSPSIDADLSDRILRLEQKTAVLGLQVDKLIKAMNRLFPSG